MLVTTAYSHMSQKRRYADQLICFNLRRHDIKRDTSEIFRPVYDKPVLVLLIHRCR